MNAEERLVELELEVERLGEYVNELQTLHGFCDQPGCTRIFTHQLERGGELLFVCEAHLEYFLRREA